MVDSKQRNTTLKKLARWTPSTPSYSTSDNRGRTASIPPLSNDAPFTHVHHDKLQQGALYIIKIKQVSLCMFEGWNDDMCCFSVLRSEVEPLRWSEARQLPGDFDIYDAFDESGNPPIHLWQRYLKVAVPQNWFSMFEEAKRKQRDWGLRQQQQQQFRQSLIQQQQQQNGNSDYYYSPPPPQQQEGENGVHITYSNTDVSTMSLNNRHHGNESIVSPSIVASTNVVDPLLNDDMKSHLSHQPSMISTTTSYNTRHSMINGGGRQLLSPTPSSIHNRDIIQQQHGSAERSNSIMDREQIRRHLAPGQAVITNRSSSSVSQVTLNSQPSTTTASPTKLVHHRSKELIHNNGNGISEEEVVKPAPTPLAALQPQPEKKEELKYNNNNNGSGNMDMQESSISALSNDLDFPHDSDQFSIRSDIATSPTIGTPNMKPSFSSKSRNRPSMKKIIWGQ